MVQITNPEIQANFRRLDEYMSSLANKLDGNGGVLQQLANQQQSLASLLNSRVNTPPSPTANLLFNGELGHSGNSWFDATYNTTDEAYEAAFFFSNNAPAGPDDFTTIVTNDLIPIPGHSFTTGCKLNFFDHGGGEVLPTGLNFAFNYFAIYVDANNISVALTVGLAFAGTAVAITAGTGSGTHTVQQFLDPSNTYSATLGGSITVINNTLKSIQHSTYDPLYSKWEREDGQAALTGTMTLDAIMPTNFVDSTTSLARVSFIAARRNSYIEIPEAALMAAGVWDATSGQCKFLAGDIGFDAGLVGPPGGTERRFRALLTSDRGYQLLSPEIIILNAPADGGLSSTNNITMSWRQQSGQLQVDLYEHYDPGGPGDEYRLLTEVSAATSFIYQGGFLRTVTGYPTPTGTDRTATFFTQVGGMASLATNAVSARWDTVNFPISVPNNYNKANTTGRQWVRIWMTVAPNMFIPGCTTDGTTTIVAPASLFDAEYDTIYDSGTLVAEVYDDNDVLITTTTVASRTNDTDLVLGASIAAGTGRKLRIVAGGFHGILLDKVHLGFQLNTSYSPNAQDNRTLQPVAAPTQSDQGGTGIGDGGTPGDGGISCIAFDTPIKLQTGVRVPVQSRMDKCGQKWADGGLNGNMLIKLRESMDQVRRVVTVNGIEILCTDTECFTVDDADINGTPLFLLREGDAVMTEVDGRIETSKIAYIGSLEGRCYVYTPSLDNSHYFIAGSMRSGMLTRFADWVLKRKPRQGGFILHNRKPFIDNPSQV